MGKDRLKPSRLVTLIGVITGFIFGAFLFCLYFAASGYQIAIIQDQLISEVQQQAPISDLASDPRFRTLLASDDAATKLILASAASLEEDQNSDNQRNVFSTLEKRKAALIKNDLSSVLFDQVIRDYHVWQAAKQAAAAAQSAVVQAAAEKTEIVNSYNLLLDDVSAVFQGEKTAAENQPDSAEGEKPFKIYASGLLAGVPRLRGIPDNITDDAAIAGYLRQPVDQSEPPSVKVERFRAQMTELDTKFDQADEKEIQAIEQNDAADEQADRIKSALRTDLFRLLSASRRTRIDDGALKVYQVISARFPA